MEKLVQGILEFRRFVFPAYRQTFSRLASGQSPDCLFVGCADSRVAPNLFASTQPGELFVVRNVGNLVPPASVTEPPTAESSLGAAIEFAVLSLQVRDVVICGHSGCGAMKGLLQPPSGAPHLSSWLANGQPSQERMSRSGPLPGTEGLPPWDQLSQQNVLQQMEHVSGYPCVRDAMAAGKLRVHGWWFDIATAEVHAWDAEQGRFHVIDEALAEKMLGHALPTS